MRKNWPILSYQELVVVPVLDEAPSDDGGLGVGDDKVARHGQADGLDRVRQLGRPGQPDQGNVVGKVAAPRERLVRDHLRNSNLITKLRNYNFLSFDG